MYVDTCTVIYALRPPSLQAPWCTCPVSAPPLRCPRCRAPSSTTRVQLDVLLHAGGKLSECPYRDAHLPARRVWPEVGCARTMRGVMQAIWARAICNGERHSLLAVDGELTHSMQDHHGPRASCWAV